MKVHSTLFPVHTLGPGKRAVIWTQGCSIGCPGCMSSDTWDRRRGSETGVDELVAAAVGQVGDGLQGVTVSGGEPFEQPDELARLLQALRTRLPAEADLLVFSGYTIKQLRSEFTDVLRLADAVVAGPYVASRPSRLAWRSSTNQILEPQSSLGDTLYGPHAHAELESPTLQVKATATSITLIGVPPAGLLAASDSAPRQLIQHGMPKCSPGLEQGVDRPT